jgi:pyruvate formate-lyase activating enzyme-like uncharacterized protein
MIRAIREADLAHIRNPVLADYARIYLRINENFMQQLETLGLEIDGSNSNQPIDELGSSLGKRGAILRNQSKSIYINRISPACLACRTGMGSATFFISLKCHRDCFYCFNPHQENYAFYLDHSRDLIGEVEEIRLSKKSVDHLALTGGEPLLFKTQALAFFTYAQRHFPKASTRLYTCGDHADANTLAQLGAAGLDEIRFSIRMHDLEKGHRLSLERIAQAKAHIPRVMVEMPVLPGTLEAMQQLLMELEQLDIFGINLLELCYPFNNAAAFRQRGYQLKGQPYRVLYDYWYAGGLPVAGSEALCLQLLDFALDQGLRIGVHYCSLENKHTSQVYQQNKSQPIPKHAYFSDKDFFIKTAKVFGEDIPPTLQMFKKENYRHYVINENYHFLEFHPQQIRSLVELNPEIGISYSIWDRRGDESLLRELRLDYTTAGKFEYYQDV